MASEKTLAFVQAIYFDATTTIRHYDSSRTTFVQLFTAVLVLLTSAGVFASGEGSEFRRSIVLTASGIAVLLTLLACAIVLRFNALIGLQRLRATLAMKRYEELSEEPELSSLAAQARAATNARSLWLPSMASLWILLLLAIGAGNVVVFSVAWAAGYAGAT